MYLLNVNASGVNLGVTPTGPEINGPECKFFNSYDAKFKAYGSNGAVEKIISFAQENKNKDYEDLSTENEHKFSFGYFVDGSAPALWMNTVLFELEDGAISKLDIKSEKYTDYSADYENEGVYYVNDGASSTQTYTIKFEQKVEERTAVNPYDIDAMYFTAFNFKDGDNSVTDTIVMDAGVQKTLTMVDAEPSTANAGVDKITLNDPSGKVSGNFNATAKTMSISCREVGEYTVTISSKNVSKEYKVVVNKPAVSSISLNYYVQSGNQYTTNMLNGANSTVNIYENIPVYFAASFSPSTADQEYTVEAIGDNKDKVQLTKEEIKPSANMPRVVMTDKVLIAEAGTYTVKFTSTSNPDVFKEVSVVVSEAPAIETLVQERYVSVTRGTIYVDVKFTPDATDASKGKVFIDDINALEVKDNGEFNYTYDATTRKFNLVKLDEEGNPTEDAVAIGLEFDGNYNLVLVKTNTSVALKVFTYEAMIINAEWQYMDSRRGFVQFSFSAGGTGRFNYTRNDPDTFQTIEQYSCPISYTIEEREDGVYIVLDAASKAKIYESEIVTEIGDIKISDDFKRLNVTATIKGTSEVCDLTRGG